MNNTGIIYGINGPVVYLKGNNGFRMSEMVHVGDEHLVGEVIYEELCEMAETLVDWRKES